MIKRGVERRRFSWSKNPFVYNWQQKFTNYDSQKINLVSSSGIIPKDLMVFDEQGMIWSDNFCNVIEYFKNIKIINIGINGLLNSIPDMNTEMSEGSKKQLISLKSTKITKIWARGEVTKKFLTDLGLKNVEVLGCPSFRLLGRKIKRIDQIHEPFTVLLTGSAVSLSLSLFPVSNFPELKFIFIPQSKGEALFPIVDSREFTTFHVTSFHEWSRIIKSSKIDFIIGTRLHTCILGLSLGIPSVVISGDLRVFELSRVAPIPYFDNFESFSLRKAESKLMGYNQKVGIFKDLVRAQNKFIST